MIHDYLYGLGILLLAGMSLGGFLIFCIIQMAKDSEVPPKILLEEVITRVPLRSLSSIQKDLWILKMRAANCCLRWQAAIDEQQVRGQTDPRLVVFMKKFELYELERDDCTLERLQILVRGELEIICRFMRAIREPDYQGPPYATVFSERVLEGIPHMQWLPEANLSVPFLDTQREIVRYAEHAERETRLAEIYLEGLEGEIRSRQQL